MIGNVRRQELKRKLGLSEAPALDLQFQFYISLMHGTQLDFHVTGGTIHVTAFTQWECRGDCSYQLNWPEVFEGRTGYIYYGDSPPPDEIETKELNFCSTVRPEHPGPWLPFPCFTWLRRPQIGVPDAEVLLEELLADEKEWESPKLFWIGTDQHSSRRALWELGKKHPEVMDIELMEWELNKAIPNTLVSKSRQVSLPEHRNFKYLVDCPGRGYSARLKWLVATGRPVFIVARDIVEPWHLEMKPWVHFVPVAANLSDLLEHHARLEAEPELYNEIARNARKFAAERLRVEPQLIHVAERISEKIGSASEPTNAEKNYGI